MEELIDIYDERGEHIGSELRSVVHAKGLWHRTAQVWLLNEKDELLLQFRSCLKDCFPELWDISSAGHIPAGCEPKVSAVRELYEELGVVAKEEELIFLFEHVDPYEDKRNGHIDREIAEVYLLMVDSNTSFNLQKEEVDKVRWLPYKKLLSDYYENLDEYVPHESHFKKIIEFLSDGKFMRRGIK